MLSGFFSAGARASSLESSPQPEFYVKQKSGKIRKLSGRTSNGSIWGWFVVLRSEIFYFPNNALTIQHFPKNDMFAVKVWRWNCSYEKLRAIGAFRLDEHSLNDSFVEKSRVQELAYLARRSP